MTTYKNVGGPREGHEVPDESLTLKTKEAGDMRDGEPLEYDYQRFAQARGDTPSLFENIVRRAEIAKALILTDEAIKLFDYQYPEVRLIQQIDAYIAKSGTEDKDLDDVQKTNLPHKPVKEKDSVSTLSPEEAKRSKKV